MTSTAAQLEHLKLVTEFIDMERCKHTIARPGEPVTYETWTRTKQIGEGGFGVVYRETCSERSTEVRAVKQIRKSSLRWAEVGILAQLRSNPEHFVQITGWFEDKYHIYLAMEYLPGDLGGLLKGSARGLREDESKGVSKQILAGLAILHEMSICHRDLKPGNILISNWVPLRVKIGDFGVSKLCDGNTEWRTTTGTRPFMAPEIQDLSGQGSSVYTTAVDIWSMGCLVYFMITNTPPFPEPRSLSHFLRDQSLFPPSTEAAQTIPDSAVGFITSLLQPLPENRPPASRALMHSWLLIQDQDETLWPTNHTEPDAGKPAPAPEPKQSTPAAKGRALAIKGKSAAEDKSDQKKQPQVSAGLVRSDVLQHLLVAAAASGNCELLVQQLGKGARPMEDPSGYTPMYVAAKNGHLSIIKLLLEHGAHLGVGGTLGVSTLHGAAIGGNLQIVQYLVEKGANISERGEVKSHGWTALLLAACNGQLEIVVYLLDGGADILAKKLDNGFDSLHLATQAGHYKVVKLLLDKGADITATAEHGRMAHHLAAMQGATEVLQLLSDRGADISAPTANAARWTALMYAAWKGHLNAARYLLDRGADITAANDSGAMALHLAAQHGATDVLKLLLERGADISAPTADAARWTALMYAAWKGHLNAARYLLDRGADITAANDAGMMALHLAAQYGATDVLKLLLERGADISARDVSPNPWTALMFAAYHNQLDTVRYLLDRGADITATAEHGRMAHHLAAIQGSTEVLQLLSDRGADISAPTAGAARWTALMYAAWKGHLNAARYLLDRGADITAANDAGLMALHVAAQYGATDVLKLLLERGADISARDVSPNPWTALMFAAYHNQLDTVRYLLDRGASTSVTSQGQTAISLAANKGHTEIAVLLSEWYEKDASFTLVSLDSLRLPAEDSTQTMNEEYESMTLWDSTE